MEIGIIGTGSVGQALATGLSAAGHDPILGSREPETTKEDGFEVTTQREAATSGDTVVLAVPASVIVDIAAELRDELAGKPVLNTANEFPTPGGDRSLAERVADAAPQADVVKAFNTIGANRMTDPVIDALPASMFLAGDAPEAVDTAVTLVVDLGFHPVVAGDLAAASHLEDLARFWIHLSREHGRDIGFRLLQEA